MGDLLVANPGVTLLVTSRERLHLRFEQTFQVLPLRLPDPQHLPALEELSHIAAVALFLQRARTLTPAFPLTKDNARAVAELCVHLDGLPLAIELAAARTTLLSPQMILERLGQRLSLLHWQAHDLPERQQTLRAAIAWSYDLLSSEEQALFRRLGIFTGSFSLEAAEAIADDTCDLDDRHSEPTQVPRLDALEGLASLVNKSLVQVQRREEDIVGYSLLESVRAFALGQLTQAGELDAVGRSHALYYLDLAEQAEPEFTGQGQRGWFLRLEQEYENLRAALHWFADHDDGERGLRLATALGYFWEARGCMVEGRRELEAALARASAADPSLRARALTWLGALLIWTLGDEEGANGTAAAEHATAVVNQALELARTVEDTVSIAQSLSHLGVLSLHTRNWDQGRRCLDEAQHYWQEAQHAWGIAHTLLYLGALELMQGHHEDAVRFAEESLVRSRDLGDDLARGLALVLLMLATGARADVSRAITLVRELLALSHETQNRRLMVLCAGGVAWLLGHQSEPKRLTRLLGAARAMRQATGFVGSQPLRGYVAIAGETLQARLGAEAFEAGLREGHALSFEQMTALIGQALDGALGDGAPTEAAPEPIKRNILSPREQEVLHLVAQGLSNKRIAQEIIVAEITVRYHLTSIFNKLGVDSRAHAIAVAAHRGLVLL